MQAALLACHFLQYDVIKTKTFMRPCINFFIKKKQLRGDYMFERLSMNRNTTLVIALLCTMLLNVGLAKAELAQTPPMKRKVLLFLIDGVTPVQLQKAKTPSLDALGQAGLYSPDVQTVSRIVSAPDHSDIVTGVGSPKHGAKSNSFKPGLLHYDQYPDFLTRIER
jgi:hypothetical protein